jgi:enamine deaminase RidA (YjgF/YER057c/UK114 family)
MGGEAVSDGRTTYSDGTAFEERASYSRAVRVGTHVAVSGTAAIGPDGVLHPGDTYRQTAAAIEKALAAAAALGAAPGDVIRTRMLLAPAAAWEDAVRAHGEAFARIAPANTTYIVAGFIPDVLVEVELDAIIQDAG